MMYRNGRLAGAFILIACGVFATASAQPPAIAPAGSLYARLGGTPVVSAFVADTIDKLVPENPQRTKSLLTQRICTLTGGGCADIGADADFSGFIEALRESMRAHDVPLIARNQLLEILAPADRNPAKP